MGKQHNSSHYSAPSSLRFGLWSHLLEAAWEVFTPSPDERIVANICKQLELVVVHCKLGNLE